MADGHANGTGRRNIITISAAKHITGEPVAEVIEKVWAKTDDATRARFNIVGFDFDPTDVPATLSSLRQSLQGRTWDGLLLGWCLRGYPERTEMFEEAVNVCIDEIRSKPETKLLFCTGPKNLVEATLRSFP